MRPDLHSSGLCCIRLLRDKWRLSLCSGLYVLHAYVKMKSRIAKIRINKG